MVAATFKQQKAGFLAKLSLGICGVSQMAHAALACPSRNLPEDTWNPAADCLQEAQTMADGHPEIMREDLDPHLQKALKPITFKTDPSDPSAAENSEA